MIVNGIAINNKYTVPIEPWFAAACSTVEYRSCSCSSAGSTLRRNLSRGVSIMVSGRKHGFCFYHVKYPARVLIIRSFYRVHVLGVNTSTSVRIKLPR
jgi:hypothetical protein